MHECITSLKLQLVDHNDYILHKKKKKNRRGKSPKCQQTKNHNLIISKKKQKNKKKKSRMMATAYLNLASIVNPNFFLPTRRRPI